MYLTEHTYNEKPLYSIKMFNCTHNSYDQYCCSFLPEAVELQTNVMEYVVWAKHPALGPVRSFSSRQKKERKKKNKSKKKASNKIREDSSLLPLKPPHDDNGLDIEGELQTNVFC